MCYSLCSIIGENLYFVFSHVKAKLNDDLLMGREHTRKIIPDCHTPSPQRMLTLASEVSLEEKIGIIIDDPKFGMFGLFKYQINKGYKNKVLKQHNYVGGLISENTPTIEELNGETDYKLVVKHSIVDSILSLLSFGLYTPTTIIIYK